MENLNNQSKSLQDWAMLKLPDKASRFLQFCKNDCREATEVVPYAEFLTLKEQFES